MSVDAKAGLLACGFLSTIAFPTLGQWLLTTDLPLTVAGAARVWIPWWVNPSRVPY